MDSRPLIRYPPSNNSLLSSGNTKKSITYEPRTEAISPAVNDDIIAAEETATKSTKDEQTLLVEKLKKVEAEIMQTDLQIARLQKQKQQLEQAASSANKDDDEQENVCDTKQLSIAKLVYHENRAKAQKTHAKLESLTGIVTSDLPIYNQPSDNAIYHQNASKFNSSFKNELIIHFKIRQQNRLKLEETVSLEYNRRMEKWLKNIEQEDSQQSKRIKDARMREFFERTFPELKKARESGERFSRVGQRVARSDAELDELLDGINEREYQVKKVKSLAVIPPMLEEMRSTKPKFNNTNGFVEDILAEYKEYQILNTWTDEEKDIFRENYLQHPKNFGLIASLTTRKNVANCVQYYYLSKKSENYKQMLKRQQKRRTRSFVRPAAQTPAVTAPETNDASKSNNAGANDKQAADATNGYAANHNGKSDSSNESTSMNSHLDAADQSTESERTCCICSTNDTNQFRNVTRSNHQLYGIGLEALKPGMKICFPCRFRNVKHPSFDEPSLSPEPMEEIESLDTCMMEVDAPVATAPDMKSVIMDKIDLNRANKMDTQQNEAQHSPLADTMKPPTTANSAPNSDVAKGQQRTCVRDIIYQAIEMSFQESKSSVPPIVPLKPEPNVPTDRFVMNQILPPQHVPGPSLPLKPIGIGLPIARALAPPSAGPLAGLNPVPSAHPLNLCRLQQNHVKVGPPEPRPPPVAHGGRVDEAAPPRAVVENDVLNLCVKMPPKFSTLAPPLPQPHLPAPPPPQQQPHLQLSQPLQTQPLLSLHPQSQPQAQPQAQPQLQTHPHPHLQTQTQSSQLQQPQLNLPPRPVSLPQPVSQQHQHPSSPAQSPTCREGSKSPNFTASPTSPSEMVIDESADVHSSPPSPDRDVTTK